MKTHETADLLAALLGEIHALHEPVFTPNPAAWQHRAAYAGRLPGWTGPPGCVAWSNPGDTPTARKRWTRARAALERGGHAMVSGAWVGLTASGFDAARRACGLPTLGDALPLLDKIHALCGGGHEWVDLPQVHGYVSEASLCGLDPLPPGEPGKARLPDSAMRTRDRIVCLLVAGLASFNHSPLLPDLPLYRLTVEGAALATARMPGSGTFRPKRTDATSEVYAGAWLRTVDRLRHADAPRPNVVRHGLSTCVGPRAWLTATA